MTERPLVIPILISPPDLYPDSSTLPTLPIQPTHLASWQSSSESSATSTGVPSTFTALASADNSIWILEERSSGHQAVEVDLWPTSPQPSAYLPSPLLASPSSPRTLASAGLSSPSTYRSRAASTASSTPTTNTARRRVSAFSPPQPPAICITTTSSATPALDTSGTTRLDREELLETLREQKGRDSISSAKGRESHESGRGLGIGGLGRKGLPGALGKDETTAEKSRPVLSRRSSVTTLGTRRDGTKMSHAELQEDVEERAVEAEMERERREDEQESEDKKKVSGAGSHFREMHAAHAPASALLVPSTGRAPKQVILPGPGRGKVVAMVKISAIGSLVVLRSSGDLDFISLADGQPSSHVDLAMIGDTLALAPSTFSSLRKQRIRLQEPLNWQGIEHTEQDGNVILVIHAIPFPNLFTQNADGTTKVQMLAVLPDGRDVQARGRVELPGIGTVACGRTKQDVPFLLHSTTTSLMAYPIVFPADAELHDAPAQPSLHKSRSVSTFHSLLPPVASKPRLEDTHGDVSRPLLGRSSSHSGHTVPADSTGSSSRFDAFSDSLGGKSLSKLLASRKLSKSEGKASVALLEVGVGEGLEVERDGGGGWSGLHLEANGTGVGWANDSFDLFEVDLKSLSVLGSHQVDGPVLDVRLGSASDAVYVSSASGAAVYIPTGAPEQSSSNGKRRRKEYALDQRFSKSRTAIDVDDVRILYTDEEDFLAESVLTGGHRRIAICGTTARQSRQISSVLQLGNDVSMVCDDEGNITRTSFARLPGKDPQIHRAIDADRLPSRVTCLMTCIPSIEGRNPAVVAGDEDGAVRLWDAQSMNLLGSWTMFADPVRVIVQLDTPTARHLRGCLLCVSEDGTISIFSVDSLDVVHTIPGSRAQLHRVFIGWHNILVTYTNGKARVWNTDTGEFRRSTGLDAAEEMVKEGEWEEVQLDALSGEPMGDTALTSARYPLPCSSDSNRLIRLDLRQLGRRLQYNASSSGASSLDLLRSLLSVFLTFGLDECCDTACTQGLGIVKPETTVAVGEQNASAASILHTTDSKSIWTQRPSTTAIRQLAIVSMLRPFLDDPDSERWAAEAIAFYATALADTVGEGFVEPPLSFFAEHYLDSAVDVHQAARMLFGGRLGRMQEDDIETLVDSLQGKLPINQKPAARQSVSASEALTVIGGIALERYTSMSPSVLKQTALSIALYLHDDQSPHKALAIELCSKGFQTWQAYTDAMDLLRRLFHLATRKEPQASSSVTGSGIAAQARIAVLHIAGSNTPLFMTTLSMDILDAQSVEHRTSIMKLCVFMARKRPEILEHGLPRIAEAVVKSLDPNIASMREEVWHAATVILNELVLAFPAIDFFSGTQKLAVGTHEGAIIMYELKTASRLYVLEPHAHPVSAVAFSTDGRRLITVCLDEGVVTVWKIGSSLSGFFTVGGPPRQGGAAGEPFKRYEFTRIDNAPLDATAALNVIRISWPALRTVKIEIQETAMSFAT